MDKRKKQTVLSVKEKLRLADDWVDPCCSPPDMSDMPADECNFDDDHLYRSAMEANLS